MHIAIVALGPSSLEYVMDAEAAGGRENIFDEVWTVNSFGGVLDCDLVFHMDDVRVQEQRDNPKVQNMLKWLSRYDGRVLTSRAHPDYPCLEDYPLEEVINSVGTAYFNSTVSYAVAYAIHYGATRLHMYGVDFTWPDSHKAEQGRACVEYWLGRAMQKGIAVCVTPGSHLMDRKDGMPLYGYDTIHPEITFENDRATVTFIEKDAPTGTEIEKRYNHERTT